MRAHEDFMGEEGVRRGTFMANTGRKERDLIFLHLRGTRKKEISEILMAPA